MRSRLSSAHVALLAAIAASAHGGCLALTSFDGLTGGSPDAGSDGEAIDANANAAAASTVDANAASTVSFASCAAAKASSATDGFYTLDPDGDAGPAPPFVAYCDMTNDGGGWMLVTKDMAGVATTSAAVTPVLSNDDKGGLVVRVYANATACAKGTGGPNTYFLPLLDRVPWTLVRARYVFAGGTSCWVVFGGSAPDWSLQQGVLPFDRASDTIRDEVRMGGTAGDAFDGVTYRCDNVGVNFWHANRGYVPRSALVVLRRRPNSAAAGLGTYTACTEVAPGTTSPTYWEYREIYVR